MKMTGARERSTCCRLGRQPVQVGRAREQARQALSRWGLSEHADLAELIVSELATKAMGHSDGVVHVRVSYARGELRVEVHDDAAGRPVRQHPAADDESGRGLALIDGLIGLHGGRRAVADDSTGRGKTVYVAICLGADEDTGTLVPDGTVIEPHRAASRSSADGLLSHKARPRGGPRAIRTRL